jgi:hypothetical protein
MKPREKINHTNGFKKNKGENKKKLIRGQTKIFNRRVKFN